MSKQPDKRFHISHPEAFAVCMAFDAMRLCLGGEPKNFTFAEVVRWLRLNDRALSPTRDTMTAVEEED